MGRDVY